MTTNLWFCEIPADETRPNDIVFVQCRMTQPPRRCNAPWIEHERIEVEACDDWLLSYYAGPYGRRNMERPIVELELELEIDASVTDFQATIIRSVVDWHQQDDRAQEQVE